MSAANEEYVIARRNAEGSYEGGNMTAWLGVGGDTANAIESIISEYQDKLIIGNFKPSMLLDTDSMMEEIRTQLSQTGDYTEEEIEKMVSKLESRVHKVRVKTALETELGKIDTLDDKSREQIRDAILEGFNPTTGEFDLVPLRQKSKRLTISSMQGKTRKRPRTRSWTLLDLFGTATENG